MLSTLLPSPPSSSIAQESALLAVTKTRTYEEALDALISLPIIATAVMAAMRAPGGKDGELAMAEMIEYLGRIGYKADDLNRLNVIHVAGTKGKGSTCAFTASILRKTFPEWKIGLLTSPHLVCVRERIRVNGEEISEADFAKYFYEVWDRLQGNTVRKHSGTSLMPESFRFMPLLAFHYFLSLKVDAVVMEVGVGGFYDSSNVVPKPMATGVTSLALDHVTLLGGTFKEIAWHKGGIYKDGVPALTVEQPEEATTVLKERATTLRASSFTIVPTMLELNTLKLGIAGSHQVKNASLAVNLAHQFILSRGLSPGTETGVKSMSSLYPTPLPPSFIAGLECARWPGRCQEVEDPNHSGITWFLDGAHTIESLIFCAEWFFHPGVGLMSLKPAKDSPSRKRILIFNCTGDRPGSKFLSVLTGSMKSQLAKYDTPTELVKRGFFDHVIFSADFRYVGGGSRGLAPDQPEIRQKLAMTWAALYPLFPAGHIHTRPCIEQAVKIVHDLRGEGEIDVLVTGSLYLVGGVMDVADIGSVALAM